MPRYDYKCAKCGEIVEKSTSFSDRDGKWKHSKECKGDMVRGWYTSPALIGFNNQGSSSW